MKMIIIIIEMKKKYLYCRTDGLLPSYIVRYFVLQCREVYCKIVSAVGSVVLQYSGIG